MNSRGKTTTPKDPNVDPDVHPGAASDSEPDRRGPAEWADLIVPAVALLLAGRKRG